MNALRATLLMLVALWTAAAGGLAGALHVCQMAAAPTACVCPHSAAQQTEGAQFRRAECCELSVTFAASVPAVTDGSRQASLLAAPALAPESALPPAAGESAEVELQLRGVPWPQGPPLFLKVRSLLI